MNQEIQELSNHLLEIKSMFRQVAVDNWKKMEELDVITEKLSILNRVPVLKKEYDEIKYGIAEYKKALDAVIYKFS